MNLTTYDDITENTLRLRNRGIFCFVANWNKFTFMITGSSYGSSINPENNDVIMFGIYKNAQ